MPWVDKLLCLSCMMEVETANGELPPGPCQVPEGEEAPEEPCTICLVKVMEPEKVMGGGLFGKFPASPRQGRS